MAFLVHGYNSGHYLLEQRVWPLAWLDRIGLDVALFVLPHHGLRAKATTRLPSWPSRDPHVTLEGFRRAVSDLRALVRHFRAEGVPHVGLFGMSLGAYTASLTATLEPLDFLVPVTPLASLVEFAREHGQFGPTAEDPELCARFESALACVSPLARKSRVARGCAVVVAAEEDRITPLPHAERLARHFGAELAVYPGSHLIHVGIGHGYRAARAMLEREAILRTSEGRKVPPRAFAA
jgi:pimeloyl-ACP methyl ester carboxylesterase